MTDDDQRSDAFSRDGAGTGDEPVTPTFISITPDLVGFAELTADETERRILEWARTLPPSGDPFAYQRYLETPSMWEPDKPADPETMRQAWADAHDEFQRRMRGEGLRIDPTEGATDD